MLEFPHRIGALRQPRARTVALLFAAAIAAIVVVTLLTPGGHGGVRRPVRQRSVAVAARPSRHTCGSSSFGHGRAAPSLHARRSGLYAVLDAALRAARRRAQVPGATAAVVVCGHVVWAGASGVLDLRSRRPVGNGSLFILNSAVKTIVAAMVMTEVQDGHLSLGSRLSRFYPRLPNARQISVRMLLNMTSGLPEYLDNPRVKWTVSHRPRHHWTVDQVLTALGAGLGAPKFPPGREFQYSDTNYIVLGAILQRITHSSIQRIFQQLIAGPLGITSATFARTPAAAARLAHPYLRQRNGSLTSPWIPGFGVPSVVWGPVFTDGGLAASSLDLARFGNALLGGRLVKAALVRQMTRIGRGNYGLGIRGRSFEGRFWLGHRGYYDGFEAEDWTDAARKLTVAAATNLQTVAGGEPTSTRIWTAIVRAYDRETASSHRAGVR